MTVKQIIKRLDTIKRDLVLLNAAYEVDLSYRAALILEKDELQAELGKLLAEAAARWRCGL